MALISQKNGESEGASIRNAYQTRNAGILFFIVARACGRQRGKRGEEGEIFTRVLPRFVCIINLLAHPADWRGLDKARRRLIA